MAQVFISYSRKDKEFVQKLVDALVAANREVWLDHRNIEPTAEWLKEIFNNIEGSDNFLFVISPDSVVSTYARKEIDHAALNNKRIVPSFYHPVPDKDIPEAVAKFQRIDFIREWMVLTQSLRNSSPHAITTWSGNRTTPGC